MVKIRKEIHDQLEVKIKLRVVVHPLLSPSVAQPQLEKRRNTLANHCLANCFDSKLGEISFSSFLIFLYFFVFFISVCPKDNSFALVVSQAFRACSDMLCLWQRGSARRGACGSRGANVFIASQKPINAQPARSTCYNSLRLTLFLYLCVVSFFVFVFPFVCKLIYYIPCRAMKLAGLYN